NQDDEALEEGLIGYWTLSEDVEDRSGNDLQTKVHGKVRFEPAPGSEKTKAAVFDGRGSWLQVQGDPPLELGTGDFSITGWIFTEESLDDVPGNIISQYDRSARRGFILGLIDNASPTSHSNFRQVGFGIDDNQSSGWKDYGKPGNALLAFGLASYQGDLYAGTCEVGEGDFGHVYRYGEGDEWISCGAPD